MSTIYENINTFNDEIYKSDLREKVLNPMIVQHNHHSVDLNNHEARIDALEEGGVGGGVTKFKDLHDVPDYMANKFLKVNTSGDLEWASVSGDVIAGPTTFIEMTDTPATYEGAVGKILQVGPEGNSLVFVDAPSGGGSDYDDTIISGRVDAVETALEGVYTKEESDTKFALKGDEGGGYDDTILTGKVTAVETDVAALTTRVDTIESDITDANTSIEDHTVRISALESGGSGGGGSPNFSTIKFDWSVDNLPSSSGSKTIEASAVKASSFFISATTSETSPLIVNLPEVVNGATNSSKVNGGRMWYFTNTGASVMKLRRTGTINKIITGPTQLYSELEIPPMTAVSIMSVANEPGTYLHWVVISVSDLNGVSGILAS